MTALHSRGPLEISMNELWSCCWNEKEVNPNIQDEKNKPNITLDCYWGGGMRELWDYCLIGKTLTTMRLDYMATPLSLRTGNGYEGVYEKRGWPRDSRRKGGTLFSRAAETGQEGAIELPVERGGDYSGVTLLSLATENYDKLVVGLLRARETTTPSAGEQLREVSRDLPLNVYICHFCNITTAYTLIREVQNENKTNMKRGETLEWRKYLGVKDRKRKVK